MLRLTKCLILFILLLPTVLFAGAHNGKAKEKFEEVILDVRVNAQKITKNMILLRKENTLWMSEQDLAYWRINQPADAQVFNYAGTKYYKISAFSDIKTDLNQEAGTLALDLPPSYFQANQLTTATPNVVPHLAPNGGYLNYDFFAQGGQNNTNIDTTLDFGLFNRYGVGNASFLGRNIDNNGQIIRLDTTWTVDKPFNLASLRLGDGISRGGTWGRPIRFGGIQWSTNFATQPEFITTPLLNFSSFATLPSTLDLFINNVQTYQQQLAPGAFSINNLPLVSGAGDARLVVRDIFGREQVIIQPYYVSRSLLREGLSDYSYEVGKERLNYTVQSGKYDRLSASGTHRYGFTNAFTGEVHADAQEDRRSLGVTGVYRLGYFGVVDASVAASDGDKGAGQLAVLGFERQANRFSFGGRSQVTSRDFSYQGMQMNDSAPAILNSAFAGVNLQQYGAVNINYIRQKFRTNTDVEIVSTNYNKNLSRDWFVNVNAFKSLQDNNYNVGLNLVYVIADRTSASLTTNNSNNDDQTLLQVQRNLPIGEGVGYRVLSEVQANKRLEAGLSYQNNIGTYVVEASKVADTTFYRGSISGSVARLGGENYFSRRLGESFAVVDVAGYKDVRVYSQNQLVGTSNAKGRLLVPGLRPYQRNQIAIEPSDLPLEASIDTYKLEAIPYFNSADYVKFVINSERSATLTIVDAQGKAIPAGAEVQFADQPNQFGTYPIAAEGEVYMRGFKARSHLIVTWLDNRCEFDVDYPETQEVTPNLGTFTCQ